VGRAELGAVQPLGPELGVLHAVERDPDRRQAGRAGRGVLADLVGVAEVDDGADAVALQRAPSLGAQLLEGVGADERAVADAAEAAEVADVAATVPGEVSFHRAEASARRPPRANGFRLS
jgi:hypothetical protein